jgi:hypothetical protein
VNDPPGPARPTFLGIEKNVAVMLAVFLVLGMGEELWARFLPKYLVLLGATGWSRAFSVPAPIIDLDFLERSTAWNWAIFRSA